MNKKKTNASTVVLVIGILLVTAAAVTLLLSEYGKSVSLSRAEKTVTLIKELLPTVYDAAPDDRGNTDMAALELNGTDYCGIIELPTFGCSLPIGDAWNRFDLTKHPCRYIGNIYEGTLIIGGSDAKGQFDFDQTISNGDVVLITDMTGGCYRYTVREIIKTRDVSTENLSKGESDLVLFMRNSTGFDYTVVRCSFAFGATS